MSHWERRHSLETMNAKILLRRIFLISTISEDYARILDNRLIDIIVIGAYHAFRGSD